LGGGIAAGVVVPPAAGAHDATAGSASNANNLRKVLEIIGVCMFVSRKRLRK
jgi:hypothetical protein